ncbi:MAG: DUF4446 family protein [Chloroflexi bacterium]|nr:DUF4446 family protein [Chloroflexota bacterium]
MTQAELERLLAQLPFDVPRLALEAYTLLTLAALALGLIALVLGLVALLRARRMQRRYQALMTGVSGTDLAALLEQQVGAQRAAERRIAALERRTANLDQDVGRIGNAETGLERLREHTADMGVHARRIAGTEQGVQTISARVADIDARLRQAVQRVGVLRYRAFEDAGEQSFAVALLDEAGDGVVLSGLHHRNGVRVYAKPVEAESSAFALSDEEQQAIQASRR